MPGRSRSLSELCLPGLHAGYVHEMRMHAAISQAVNLRGVLRVAVATLPEAIVTAAAEKQVHVVGLSILSGSHLPLVRDVVARMKEAGLGDVPVVVGGIIPPQDASALKNDGVAEVYTPKDFELNRIMSDLVRIVETAATK